MISLSGSLRPTPLSLSPLLKLLFRSGKAGRELTLVELKDHLVNVFLKKQRQYIVLFPEGGFLR